jgi:hypothetical protein
MGTKHALTLSEKMQLIRENGNNTLIVHLLRITRPWSAVCQILSNARRQNTSNFCYMINKEAYAIDKKDTLFYLVPIVTDINIKGV